MLLRLSVLLSLSILSACATYNTGSRSVVAPVSTSSPEVLRESTSPAEPQPSPGTIPGPVQDQPVSEQDPSAVTGRTPVPPTPASTLLASVDDAIAAGDLERAAALSERALRIAPRDAYLWYRLATIRYQQEQFNDAEGVARRALSFAGNDQGLTQDINLLLSRISQAGQ
jgi:tetratricopeptide (TPR) repeat protein